MNYELIEFIEQHDSYEIRELSSAVRKLAHNQMSSTDFVRADFEKMGSLGLTAMTIDEAHSGAPLSALLCATAIYELARHALGPAIYLSVHLMVSKLINNWDQQKRFNNLLPLLASGKSLAAFCLTEDKAGSDASALATRARKEGKNWILAGEKIYITSGPVADIFIVFAKTDNGTSAFIVPKETTGVKVGPAEKKMGCEGAPISSVSFHDCKLSDENLLGEDGQGYKIALSGLNGGRISIAAAACGLSAHALKIAAEHTSERKQFGSRIADFQGIQFMFADALALLQASIALTRDAARKLELNPAANAPASIAKLFATDAAMKITTDGVQFLGGAGYLKDYGAEQLMRDAKMLQIVEGTNQIQRVIIAREFFG